MKNNKVNNKKTSSYIDINNQQRFNQKKNSNPYKYKIKENQILNTPELVAMFGNPTQKRSYKKSNKLTTCTKNAILNKASQYCVITNEEKGKYKIEKVLDFSLNSKLVKFFNEPEDNLFNRILLQLTVWTILNQTNENNCLSFRLMKYAEQFNLVNKNYKMLKNRDKEIFLKTFGIKGISLSDFYTSVDNAINNSLLNILDILSDIHAIALTKNLLILTKIDENDEYYKKRATEEEEGKITTAIDEFMKINNAEHSDLFYNQKIKDKFEKHISKILKEINAVNFYRTYEVFITNSQILNYILEYNNFQEEYIIPYYLTLNGLFVEKMINNASSRNNKRILKAIKESNIITKQLNEKGLDVVDLTVQNYKEYIPEELINKIKKDMEETTIAKEKSKDYSKRSKTLVDEKEFKTLCDINVQTSNYIIPLYSFGVDDWAEGVKYSYEEFQNKVISNSDLLVEQIINNVNDTLPQSSYNEEDKNPSINDIDITDITKFIKTED